MVLALDEATDARLRHELQGISRDVQAAVRSEFDLRLRWARPGQVWWLSIATTMAVSLVGIAAHGAVYWVIRTRSRAEYDAALTDLKATYKEDVAAAVERAVRADDPPSTVPARFREAAVSRAEEIWLDPLVFDGFSPRRV